MRSPAASDWYGIDDLRVSKGLPERTIDALFDAAIGLQVRNAGYRAMARDVGDAISNQVATSDLRAMVNAGLLRARGRNRGAYYEAAEPLRAISTAARSDRQTIGTTTLFDPDAA